MHIDWFIVVSLTITFVIAGYALWLDGKNDETRPTDSQEAEKPTSR